MTTVTKDYIIKSQNLRKQIPLYAIFCFVAMLFLGMGIAISIGHGMIGVCYVVFIVVAVVIPFGYFLGIRRILKSLKRINIIKNGEFHITEQRVLNKHSVQATSTNRDWEIQLSGGDSIWVSRAVSKKIKENDICYLVHIPGDKEPTEIFNTKQFVLDSELRHLNRGFQG